MNGIKLLNGVCEIKQHNLLSNKFIKNILISGLKTNATLSSTEQALANAIIILLLLLLLNTQTNKQTFSLFH
jgi:hypothetical protein